MIYDTLNVEDVEELMKVPAPFPFPSLMHLLSSITESHDTVVTRQGASKKTRNRKTKSVTSHKASPG